MKKGFYHRINTYRKELFKRKVRSGANLKTEEKIILALVYNKEVLSLKSFNPLVKFPNLKLKHEKNIFI